MKSFARTITEPIPRDAEMPVSAPVAPGEVLLEEFLRPLGISQTDAARRLGMSLNRLNEIVNGKRGVTADTALRLSDMLGTSPQFWLNLQMNLDLFEAQRRHARAPAGRA